MKCREKDQVNKKNAPKFVSYLQPNNLMKIKKTKTLKNKSESVAMQTC